MNFSSRKSPTILAFTKHIMKGPIENSIATFNLPPILSSHWFAQFHNSNVINYISWSAYLHPNLYSYWEKMGLTLNSHCFGNLFERIPCVDSQIYWRSEIHVVFDVCGIFIFFKPITGNENLKSKFLGLNLLNLNSGPSSHCQKQGGVIVPFFGVAEPGLQPWKSKDSSRAPVFTYAALREKPLYKSYS